MDSEAMETNTLSNCNSNERVVEEKEPLFIEDRTDNFKLDHAILYKSTTVDNSKSNYGGHKQNACWNCGLTDHSLHNCPKPKNSRMIAQNRQTFHMQKQTQQQNSRFKMGSRKNVRYFVDETHDLCSRFTPGKLSDDLLKALGVPKNELPLHIYKMREHGYPSGWLEEAREEFSGISIFTAPNECLPFPGKEKGEDDVFYCKLNEKMLHEYPGFNAPCPPDTIDEHEKFGYPQYSSDQDLKVMYKRLKNTNIDTKSKELPECDSDHVAIPQTILGVKDEVPEDMSKNSIHDKDNYSSDEIVSSVEDGEITDDENVEPSSNETNDEPIELVDKQDNSEMCIDTEEIINDNTLSASLTSEISASTPSNTKRNFGDIKSEVLGTPVLKHSSPYGNRPAHEHFAKGMVDMVDHENLPNATGTFQKLKNILIDVRKTMNNFVNEYV